jgi:4-hydroxybenzoate polyprenyltransferase
MRSNFSPARKPHTGKRDRGRSTPGGQAKPAPARPLMRSRRVGSLARRFAALVKIEHTVFALPFAYVGAFLAVNGVPSARDLLWVTVAMVAARSLAMGLNRLIDARIDACNPRTATRELPTGRLTSWQVAVFCLASLGIFLLAVYQLDPLVRWLWPIPVAGFVVYPYLKRFTWLSHLWLGAVDGLAPVGAWVAITGQLPLEAWLLGGAVASWVAGFDLFYALLDAEVDRRERLHSAATRFGERGTFWGARLLHALTVALLAMAGLALDVGVFYWLGVVAVAGLLVYEHSLVRPGDLRRLDTAFFTMNGVISVAFFLFVLLDVRI